MRHSTEVVLTMSGRGFDIAPELLPWVFDLFARPTPQCIGARSSLGIGLTQVKRLVEFHGGSIEAHNGGLNRGSTFTLRLPLAGDMNDAMPVGSSRPV